MSEELKREEGMEKRPSEEEKKLKELRKLM